MIVKRFYTTLLLLAFSLLSGSVWAAESKDLFKEMATTLAQTQQFSVTISICYDALQESGEKIEFSEQRKITVQRPNNLRVEGQQSDGDKSQMIFNGKDFILFNERENVYSLTSLPGNLDEAVRHAGGKLGIRMPLARMLVTSLPQELEKIYGKSEHVERHTLGNPLEHFIARSEHVDCQVWIAEDKFPRRIVLTYKNEPGQPQFRAQFSDWNLAPKITKGTFTFTPPEGAEKIPTLIPKAPEKIKEDKKGKDGGAK